MAQRQSQMFRSFFTVVKVERNTFGWHSDKFKPFEVKEGVKLAPIQRRPPLSTEAHDHLFDKTVEVSVFQAMSTKFYV